MKSTGSLSYYNKENTTGALKKLFRTFELESKKNIVIKTHDQRPLNP